MQSISYFCTILTQIRMYPQILIRTPNIKFHKNMSGESTFFPSRDRRTDMMELVGTFYNCSVNMPKNSSGGGSFGSHAILFHSFTLHHI